MNTKAIPSYLRLSTKKMLMTVFVTLVYFLTFGTTEVIARGITDNEPTPLIGMPLKLTRSYSWLHAGQECKVILTLSQQDYDYYRSLGKSNPYTEYCTEHTGHYYLKYVASKLDEYAAEQGYSGVALMEYLVDFVQQTIRYTKDTTDSEYPRYPIETLVERKGDCEDKAALLAALLETFGFDALLVELPKHMAAAVICENCGGHYTHHGRKYAFIETTNPGWDIGELTSLAKSAGATLLDVKRTSLYTRVVNPKPEPIFVENERTIPTPRFGNNVKISSTPKPRFGNNKRVNTTPRPTYVAKEKIGPTPKPRPTNSPPNENSPDDYRPNTIYVRNSIKNSNSASGGSVYISESITSITGSIANSISVHTTINGEKIITSTTTR